MIDAPKQFISHIAHNIAMPAVYDEMLKLMAMPRARIEDYEGLIRQDSILSIRLLRIANSTFFGYGQKIDGLYEAIGLIGLIQLHDLLLGSLCMRTFYNIPYQLFNFKDFWQNSVACGIASRYLARLCRIPASNRYFTLGLLADIGHAAMYTKTPDMALEAFLQARENQCPLAETEHKTFGFDHCQLGAALARHWRLPEVYAQVIEYQYAPEAAITKYREIVAIVGLARQFTERPGTANHDIGKSWMEHQPFQHLPENLAVILENEINQHSAAVFELLSPPNPHPGKQAWS